MNKSENTNEIKALKEALKREQAKNERLKAKHKADKAEIKKLKRRKDSKPTVSISDASKPMPGGGMSPKKKERMLKSMKPLGLSDQQKEKLEELFPGITSTSSLFD